MHLSGDEEERLRKDKEQDMEEMEIILNEFQQALTEEQQTRLCYANRIEELERDLAQMQRKPGDREGRAEELNGETGKKKERTAVVKKSSKARNQNAELKESLESDLAQTHRKLEDKERFINELQNTLEEERRAKTALDDELNQARIDVRQLEERLENEGLSRQRNNESLQNSIRELQRHLEEESREKTILEERLHRLEEEKARAALGESNDWAIPREEIILSDKELGRGAYGAVFEGTFRGCKVAVKKFHISLLSDYNRSKFERELIMASCSRHPNLLQLIGGTNDGNNIWVVTELLDTSLRNVLFRRESELTYSQLVILALDVAKGLNYLHLHKPSPILHRDVSSSNVLLWSGDDTWRAKLSDYGSVNVVSEQMSRNPGARIYAAPEANTPNEQSPKVRMNLKSSHFHSFTPS